MDISFEDLSDIQAGNLYLIRRMLEGRSRRYIEVGTKAGLTILYLYRSQQSMSQSCICGKQASCGSLAILRHWDKLYGVQPTYCGLALPSH